MKIRSCRFVCSAFRPEDEPVGDGPLVVFLGRSNVGKSSLINRLLDTRGLARTSSTPGRTQSINFYEVRLQASGRVGGGTVQFIDLPGYGYARVPDAVRRAWGPMVEGFLERRRGRIRLALLVVDSRHEPTRLDRVMREWLEAREIPYVIAATKSDKLSGNGRARAARTLESEMGPTGGEVRAPPILVSAQTGLGIRDVWRRLDTALAASPQDTSQR